MTTSIVLRTAINEIDRQHAQLLTCLDDLMGHISSNYEFAAVFTAVQILLAYVHRHFVFEEDMLRSCNYPELDKHTAEHQAIESNIRSLWSQLESGDEAVTAKLVQALRHRILDHINEEDIEYSKFRS